MKILSQEDFDTGEAADWTTDTWMCPSTSWEDYLRYLLTLSMVLWGVED